MMANLWNGSKKDLLDSCKYRSYVLSRQLMLTLPSCVRYYFSVIQEKELHDIYITGNKVLVILKTVFHCD